jgi:hypothetical protein
MDEVRRVAVNFVNLPEMLWRTAEAAGGRPLDLYNALGITRSGDDRDQAGWPCVEQAKFSHGLCDHRDATFNFDLHVFVAAPETCSHVIDVLGCVSVRH